MGLRGNVSNVGRRPMRRELTDFTVVLDRSGSMEACRAEAENGLNHLIEKQKAEPGDAIFTLVQFDTEYEFVHKGVPIREVPRCELVPRGMTALLDAVGRSIAEAGERLKTMPESERPGLVVFVIVTDGAENSSHEFTHSQIKQMIEHQQSVYGWKFVFLGANQDAFAEARSLGILAMGTSNFVAGRAQEAFMGTSAALARIRTASSSGKPAAFGFRSEERKAMNEPDEE
jgi:hypothetical protein